MGCHNGPGPQGSINSVFLELQELGEKDLNAIGQASTVHTHYKEERSVSKHGVFQFIRKEVAHPTPQLPKFGA